MAELTTTNAILRLVGWLMVFCAVSLPVAIVSDNFFGTHILSVDDKCEGFPHDAIATLSPNYPPELWDQAFANYGDKPEYPNGELQLSMIDDSNALVSLLNPKRSHKHPYVEYQWWQLNDDRWAPNDRCPFPLSPQSH